MKEMTIDDYVDPQFMMLPNIMLRDYTGDVLHRTFSQLTGVNVSPASIPIAHDETRDESRVHRSVALGGARIALHECGLIATDVGGCVSPEVPVFSGESDPVHIRPRCFDRDRIDKELILLSPT